MSGKNLLDTVGKKDGKSAEASDNKPEAKAGQTIVGGDSTTDNLTRGDVLTSEAAQAASADKTVKNPDDWSKESALSEVVKLREENKAVRTKFQEQLDKVEKEKQVEIEKVREEAKTAKEAQKKLEALEAEAADKKRSIEDKLAHREARLAETEANYKHQLEEKERELASIRSKAQQYEAEQEARKSVYRSKIKEELDKIPEELRPFADKMVKGYEDPHEAWLAIAEAQRMGMFGEKKVVVNHAVPGAADGARLNKKQAEEAEKEARKKMTSKDLIRIGLENAKKGTNTAYRDR